MHETNVTKIKNKKETSEIIISMMYRTDSRHRQIERKRGRGRESQSYHIDDS